MREKEVREAEIWPRREGVRFVGELGSRSRLREVDCLRAVLKRVFCDLLERRLLGREIVREETYHLECGLGELFVGFVVVMGVSARWLKLRN